MEPVVIRTQNAIEDATGFPARRREETAGIGRLAVIAGDADPLSIGLKRKASMSIALAVACLAARTAGFIVDIAAGENAGY